MSTDFDAADIPSGPGAAAILSAGIGSLALGLFALANDAFPAANTFFTFYKPTGGLSGVTTAAIAVWLVAWVLLGRLWKDKEVAMGRINFAAFAMLGASLLLTFPPFMDFLQGK